MDLFTQFKPIRNRIKKYAPFSVIGECVRLLHSSDLYDRGLITQYQPWNLLLIIKWCLLHGDFNDTSKPPVDRNNFNRIVNATMDLYGNTRLPTDYDTVQLFLKTIAFQQFWLHRQPDAGLLGRQKLLFASANTPESITRAFEDQTGLSVHQFLEPAFMLLSASIAAESPWFQRKFFSTIERGYPPRSVDIFLALMSADLHTLQRSIHEQDRRFSNFEYTLYEQTPLKRYPLLRLGDRFLCFSPGLLYAAIETFIYDILKEWNAEKFAAAFGPLLEQYVNRGLRRTKVPYCTERELQQLIGQHQVVDFLLPDLEGNVMLEVKAVEMSALARVSPDAGVLARNLKTSAIKGIRQALSTANRLENLPDADRITAAGSPWFLLVITYKDLYLSTGENLLVGDARSEIERFIDECQISRELLPFSHIYFVSVDEFDRLTHLMASEQAQVTAIMRRAVADNAKPSEKRFSFWQHLLTNQSLV
jgi:hypothetical protein